MMKRFTLLLSIFAVFTILTACSDDEEKDKEKEQEQAMNQIEFPEFDKSAYVDIETIAEYDGGTISGEDFANHVAVTAFMNPYAPVEDKSYLNQELQFLVMQRVVTKEVKDNTWAQEQADILWEQIVQTFDEETREKGYETLGISEEDVKQYALNYYLVQDYFNDDITDEEIEQFYEKAKGSLTTATFRHILVNTHTASAEGGLEEVRSEEEAQKIIDEIQAKLDEGVSLEELADEYNEDPGSKETSGLYENMAVRSLEQNFAAAVLDQEIGVIGEPVKTAYGYHIIQVDARDVVPLEDVRDQVIQQIAYQKTNDYLTRKVPTLIRSVDESIKATDNKEEEKETNEE
ncbi:peptidylprolyl isomerase [Salirhabdus sp. Marseille-P4669]|uniref:peptidylprolyl isomerase n=1 Tax=Salirhabdus sp. Marseille-P4669 TaxID=2042310 RepID=UPI00135C0F2A|nr:peptidylprolyl isomerase [Salirhabdus sp. Marseille-P4669]